jgi:hypothetical protein
MNSDLGARENSFSEDVPYFIPRFCDAITEIPDTQAIERFQVMVRPPTVLRRFSLRQWRRRQTSGACVFSTRHCFYTGSMAVMIEMHLTGCAPAVRSEIAAIIEHAVADRPGDWRVLIIGSQANDRWEMKITGPHAFERSYVLEGSSGEHEPQIIGRIVARMVSVTGR